MSSGGFSLQNNHNHCAAISSILIIVAGTMLSNSQTAFAEVVFARIADVKMRHEYFYEPTCLVPFSLHIVALGSRGDPFFVVLEVKHEKSSNWEGYDPIYFSVRKSTEMSGGLIEYWIPKNATAGFYDVRFSVYDGKQNFDGTAVLKKLLAAKEIPSVFEVIYEPRSGCPKHEFSPFRAVHSQVIAPITVYEVKPDGLYVNGTKVIQEEKEPEQLPLTDESETPQANIEEVIEEFEVIVTNDNDVKDEFPLYYLSVIPAIVIVSVLVLKKIYKKSTLMSNQIIDPFVKSFDGSHRYGSFFGGCQ